MTSLNSLGGKKIFKVTISKEIPICLILILFTVLCFYKLNWESLWADETYSIFNAARFPQKISFSRPLYFIVLYFWMLIDKSDLWLRSLSILFGLGAILFTYLLGRYLFEKRVGLLSALLLSVSPLFINHSQEIRMYPMGTFLGVIGSIAIAHILINGKLNLLWILGWMLSRVLATLTAPLNVTLLISDLLLIYFRFRHKPKFLIRLFGPFLVLGGLIIPTMYTQIFVAAPKFVDGWTKNHSPPDITDVLGKITRLAVWPFPMPENVIAKMSIYAVTFILVCLIANALLQRSRKNVFLLAAWAFIPPIPILIFSHFFTSIWISYYLLFLAPYILMLLALGLIRIWDSNKGLCIAVSVVYTISVAAGLMTHYSTYHHEEWRAAADTIAANERASDAIVVGYEKSTYIGLPYHYHGQLKKERVELGHVVEFSQSETDDAQEDIFVGPKEHYHGKLPIHTISLKLIKDPTALEEYMQSTIWSNQDEARIWLVLKNLAPMGQAQMKKVVSGIEEKFSVEKTWQFNKLHIFLIGKQL